MLAQIDFKKLKGLAGFDSPNYPTDLGSVVSRGLNLVFPIAGILLLLYLLAGGFSLMTSGGDPKAMQSAKGRITSAVIGFVIIFAAYWITQIMGSILGLTDIRGIFVK